MWARRRNGLWLAALIVLAGSRFLFIPGQPWEQDEALFAAASLDTDITESRPHPPGFPLWVAVGKLGLWAIGDPVLTLQLVSALASIVTLIALAHLWALASGNNDLGRAAALLYGFAPAVWFHAPRAFTTTPCLCLVCCACVLWLRPQRRWLLGGAVLLAAAVCVRPTNAPLLGLVLVAALALRRSAVADWLLATVVVVAVTCVGFVPLVVDTGGPGAFLDVVVRHGTTHGGNLHLGSWHVHGLGIVRAVGGIWGGMVTLFLAGLGLWSLGRRRPHVAAWLVVLIVATAAWILLAHNRTYPRYTLPLLLLLSGPAVAGLAVLARDARRACWLAATLAAVSMAWVSPAVVAQAAQPPPPLAALTAAQTDPGVGAVVEDGGLSPFADLLMLSRRSRVPFAWRPLVAEGRIRASALPGPWAFVWTDGTPLAWIPGPLEEPQAFFCPSERLASLSQERYLTCRVARRGGIVIGPANLSFDAPTPVPLEDEITLLMQPSSRHSWFGAVLETIGGSAKVELLGGRSTRRRLRLAQGRNQVHTPIPRRGRAAGQRLTVIRLRHLSGARVVAHRVWIDPPDGRFTPRSILPREQAEGLDGLVTGTGFHSVERFGTEGLSGRWTSTEATLSVPAGRGEVTVDIMAPRPGPARVEISCRRPDWSERLEVGSRWRTVTVPLPGGHARVELSVVVTNPFVPAEHDPSSHDRRELGVVVGEVRFTPAG